jgi:hypothetical protein
MDDRTGRLDVPGTAADPDADARAQQLRAEIERTREDLSETVDAIQEKLRPGNLMASAASGAADKVKDLAATTTETVKHMASTTTGKVKDMAYSAAESTEEWWDANSESGFIGRIRSNPLPTLVAGVGLTWLAFSHGGSHRPRGYGRERPSSDEWQSKSERLSGQRRPSAMFQMDAPRRAVTEARQTLRSGRTHLESMVRDYPLAVGAAALIIGASLGMVVPETESENEWMGEARENAVRRAQDAASGAVDRVKDAAAEVVTRAAQSTEE